MKLKQLYAGISETSISGGRGAAALAIASGEKKLLFVALDVMGIDAGRASAFTGAIGKSCGIPAGDVMLVCSGSLSGPVTCPAYGKGEPDEAALDGIAAKLPGLAADAVKALAPASAGAYRANLPQVAHNGRIFTRNLKVVNEWLGVPANEALSPEGPADPDLDVFVIRDAAGAISALLWSYSATDRFESSVAVAVQKEVDRRLGRHLPCLKLAGCGANIEFTYGLDKTVDLLSSSIIASSLEACCDPTAAVGSASRDVILSVRDYSSFYDRAEIEMKCPGAVAVFEQELEALQKEATAALPASAQVFRIGGFAIAGLPGNAFAEFALDIKKRSPVKLTCATGFCNGTLGYLMPRASFDCGGFEAWPARWAQPSRGCGEFVADELAELLARL